MKTTSGSTTFPSADQRPREPLRPHSMSFIPPPRPTCSRGQNHKGFTLVELLVTLTIIIILAALVFATINSFSRRGDSAKCISTLKNLTEAALSAKADNDGKFPAFKVYSFDANGFLSSNATIEWNYPPAASSIGEVLNTQLGFASVKTMNIDPSLIPLPLRCPAARKNTGSKSWINKNAAYRYNAYAIGRFGSSPRALLFQDACWPDWKDTDYSHRGPVGLNIAYADGHVSFMDRASYLKINPDSNKEYQNQLFMQGWLD